MAKLVCIVVGSYVLLGILEEIMATQPLWITYSLLFGLSNYRNCHTNLLCIVRDNNNLSNSGSGKAKITSGNCPIHFYNIRIFRAWRCGTLIPRPDSAIQG